MCRRERDEKAKQEVCILWRKGAADSKTVRNRQIQEGHGEVLTQAVAGGHVWVRGATAAQVCVDVCGMSLQQGPSRLVWAATRDHVGI